MIEQLYDSEINAGIVTDWDGGARVWIGAGTRRLAERAFWRSELRNWSKSLNTTPERIKEPGPPAMSVAQALADIDELQRKQLRAVTELMANPNDAEARKHFDQRQIVELREQVTA